MHASAPAWEYGWRISYLPFLLGEEISSALLCSAAGVPCRHHYAASFLVIGIQLAGLFKHPAFSVGVVGWFIEGAVNLTRAIVYALHMVRARIIYFEWLFPLTGLRATESGINYRVFGVIAIISMLESVASGFAVAVSSI